MSSINRAFLFASAERYVIILLTFAMVRGWEMNLSLGAPRRGRARHVGWLTGSWLTEYLMYDELRRAIHGGCRRLGWHGRSAAIS
jgi:hypothetical protein